METRRGKLIEFEKILKIKALRDLGYSLRKIAKEANLSKTTVLKYVKMLEEINLKVQKEMLQKFKTGELKL